MTTEELTAQLARLEAEVRSLRSTVDYLEERMRDLKGRESQR